MSDLTPTIIRFPKSKLRQYKDLARGEGMSLSEFVRRVVDNSARNLVRGGEAHNTQTGKASPWIFDLKKYKKWSTGERNRDSVDHDEILYREDWKEKK